MSEFRFGVNTRSAKSRVEVVDHAKAAEEAGYDVVLVADHLGENRPAPFSTLAAMAEVTERVHLGTFVLNVCFWNPALLDREVETIQVLSAGRFELGLGAGHMKHEFDTAGIPWEPLPARLDRLRDTIQRLTTEVPLVIGGDGDGILRLAAAHADIVGFTGIRQAPGREPGELLMTTAEHGDERVNFVRKEAAGRAYESNVLIQVVVETEDRRAAAGKLVAEQQVGVTVDQALDAPWLLFGTVEEMAAQLRERRDRFGFTYIVVHSAYRDVFAPVIHALRS